MKPPKYIWLTGNPRCGHTWVCRVLSTLPTIKIIDERTYLKPPITLADLHELHMGQFITRHHEPKPTVVKTYGFKKPMVQPYWIYHFKSIADQILLVNIIRHPIDVFLSIHRRSTDVVSGDT